MLSEESVPEIHILSRRHGMGIRASAVAFAAPGSRSIAWSRRQNPIALVAVQPFAFFGSVSTISTQRRRA